METLAITISCKLYRKSSTETTSRYLLELVTITQLRPEYFSSPKISGATTRFVTVKAALCSRAAAPPASRSAETPGRCRRCEGSGCITPTVPEKSLVICPQ